MDRDVDASTPPAGSAERNRHARILSDGKSPTGGAPADPVAGLRLTDGFHETVSGRPAGRSRVCLSVVAGPMEGKEFVFDEHDAFLFGRSSACHASLPGDSYASRHHFILEAAPPLARLRDLGSLNGTYVNEAFYGGRRPDETPADAAKRAYPQVDLHDGDRVQTGETVFAVSIDKADGGFVAIQCERCGADIPEAQRVGLAVACLCDRCRDSVEKDPIQLLAKTPDADTSGALPEMPGYTIVRPLGAGGAGTVYLARRQADGDLVAVKVLLSQVAVEERARAMFVREMQALRELRHPNIVGFGDCGAAGSLFWLAMDYCNRGNAAELAEKRDGRLSVARAVPLMLQVLAGLDFAHRKGMVHRDIKPENILIHEEEGKWQARLSDFGLAKSFDRAGLSGMTLTGDFYGSYPYMPREQVTDFKRVRPAGDVWSAAATLYFLLTGAYPREVDEKMDPMMAVLEAPIIPIQERMPEIAAPVARVFEQALAIDPEDRYTNAHAFSKALKRAHEAK